MFCLKCGRETENEQVFCERCLDSMEAYPVKPGTAVQLPRRSSESAGKKSPRRKRIVPPEELLAKQKGIVRRMTAVCVILGLLLAVSTFFLLKNVMEMDAHRWIGRNYTIQTEESTESP